MRPGFQAPFCVGEATRPALSCRQRPCLPGLAIPDEAGGGCGRGTLVEADVLGKAGRSEVPPALGPATASCPPGANGFTLGMFLHACGDPVEPPCRAWWSL